MNLKYVTRQSINIKQLCQKKIKTAIYRKAELELVELVQQKWAICLPVALLEKCTMFQHASRY